MCGLAFVATKKNKNTGRRVYDLYVKQKSRGKDGFGYIAIQDGKVVTMERALDEDGIKKTIFDQSSEMILFHHRYPTSTPNTMGTAHPISVSNDELEYDYLVMHNGVITNHVALKKEHEELGYKYTTEYYEETYVRYKQGGDSEFLEITDGKYNDSESLAIEIARFFEGKQETIDAVGAAAVFVVTLEKGTDNVVDVAYGQNYGRSLNRHDRKGWILIASEGPGKEVTPMHFYHIDPTTFDTKETTMSMDRGYKSTVGYGSTRYYDHTPSVSQPKQLPAGAIVEPPDNRENPYNLVNAMYTYHEALDSGAPFSEFTIHGNVASDEENILYYVPTIFVGVDVSTRPFFADGYYYLDLEQNDVPEPKVSKERERLEELAMKYARKEYERETLQSLYESGAIKESQYKSRDASVEMDLFQMEEEMSTLGIKMDEVEETLRVAQELVEYEYADRWKN